MCPLANVIIKLPKQGLFFIGLDLQKCDYEMFVKLWYDGFLKKGG